MRIARSLLMLLRLLIAVQLIVGVGLWLGYWVGLVGLHMALGTLFVLTLWGIAIIALAKRRMTGVAVGAIVLGVVIAGFGMAQRTLLVGDLHWIVRLVHLLLGISAMPLAERMTAAVSSESSPAR